MTNDISISSKINCTHLSIQKDGDEFTIGNASINRFIRVPEIAVEIINQLNGNNTIEDIKKNLEKKYNTDIDVLDFILTLKELDLIYKIDDKIINSIVPNSSYNKWLFRTGSLFFSKYFLLFYGLSLLFCIILLITYPSVLPSYKDIFIYDAIGISIVNFIIVSWFLTMIHEIAHLLAAAKEKVSSKFQLNLRMIWLVWETDMTGLWSAPRNKRYVPFIAGMAWDVVIIFVCLLIQLFYSSSLLIEYVRLIAFIRIFTFLWQFIIYFRTDIYYVILNWKKTSSIHESSILYLKKILFRKNMDRWSLLTKDEQNNAKWFAFLYLFGGSISIGLFLIFQLPSTIYGLGSTINHLKDNSMNNYLFWDSLLVIVTFIIQSTLWLIGFKNSIKHKIQRRRLAATTSNIS
jgi:putative peptide zinc metalloprotease protein